MISLSERILIARCRGAKLPAWESFLRTHHDEVARFVFLLDPEVDKARTLEICRQTFLQAVADIDEPSSALSCRAWLLRLASTATRRARPEDASGSSPPVSATGDRPVPAPEAAKGTGVSEAGRALRRQIGRLEGPCVRLAEVWYFSRATEDEVAAALEIDLGTVSRRLVMCLHRLETVMRSAEVAGVTPPPPYPEGFWRPDNGQPMGARFAAYAAARLDEVPEGFPVPPETFEQVLAAVRARFGKPGRSSVPSLPAPMRSRWVPVSIAALGILILLFSCLPGRRPSRADKLVQPPPPSYWSATSTYARVFLPEAEGRPTLPLDSSGEPVWSVASGDGASQEPATPAGARAESDDPIVSAQGRPSGAPRPPPDVSPGSGSNEVQLASAQVRDADPVAAEDAASPVGSTTSPVTEQPEPLVSATKPAADSTADPSGGASPALQSTGPDPRALQGHPPVDRVEPESAAAAPVPDPLPPTTGASAEPAAPLREPGAEPPTPAAADEPAPSVPVPAPAASPPTVTSPTVTRLVPEPVNRGPAAATVEPVATVAPAPAESAATGATAPPPAEPAKPSLVAKEPSLAITAAKTPLVLDPSPPARPMNETAPAAPPVAPPTPARPSVSSPPAAGLEGGAPVRSASQGAPAVAEPPRPKADRQWPFVRATPATPLRRNFNSPPPPAVLNAFVVEVAGLEISLIDADGSVYRVMLDPGVAAGAANTVPGRGGAAAVPDRPAEAAPPAAGGGVAFQAVGIHRSTEQWVVVRGQFVRPEAPGRSTPVPEAAEPTSNPLVRIPGFSDGDFVIRGDVRLGERSRFSIEARPQGRGEPGRVTTQPGAR